MTGLTRDAGWQAGASRTLSVGLEELWNLLIAPEGLALWLGPLDELPGGRGMPYRTADGVAGEVRTLHPHERIRLTWCPPGRPDPAILQLTLRPAANGTTLRLHADRLATAAERAAVIAGFHTVLEQIAAAISD